jgi:hypothetical protein
VKRFAKRFVFLALLLIAACGPSTTSSESGSDAADDVRAAADTGSDAAVDGGSGRCCPRDEATSGCTYLGGPAASGCFRSCDFYCSTNWRVELDEAGCEVWRWDIRGPAPGEDDRCFLRSPGVGYP